MTEKEALLMAINAIRIADFDKDEEAIEVLKKLLKQQKEKYTYGTPLLDSFIKDKK